MSLNEETRAKIQSLIDASPVVLFMKGNRAFPQCGFSARVTQILDGLLPEYETVDVLAEPDVREGIKTFSSWPTIPQLYIQGELIGGCDIVTEMFESGELPAKLGIELPEVTPPQVQITDAAAQRIREHAARAGADPLRLSIDARFQPQLAFGPPRSNDVTVDSNGIHLAMDPLTATRADGLSLDVVETLNGATFKIENPNAPGTR